MKSHRKRVAVLGSTGSIGINTLKVIERLSDRFEVVALTAYDNARLLSEQAFKYKPKYIAASSHVINDLKQSIDKKTTRIYDVKSDLEELVSKKDIDIVVLAMRGSAALSPFISAVKSGKMVTPANKEALVIAGSLILKEALASGAVVIPVDSEQSAIFQCLQGQDREALSNIHLTASGGPLLNTQKQKFKELTVKEILSHPRWNMGKKITVDSATLMNKGFEVIEARWLFDVPFDKIKVLIHPEAIIHSMVEFRDGSIIAQMGVPDMRLPIQYALTYPERLSVGLKPVDFYRLKKLHFEAPDMKKFPCLRLAIDTGNEGGTLPAVLNAADEVAVDAFLRGDLAFHRIFDVVATVVRRHKNKKEVSLDGIRDADTWARKEASALIKKQPR
jgi:1-deoxy-D-xylulose-5-phosphate reductoisomerase